jgi:serine/threonine-protein kinase MRCK
MSSASPGSTDDPHQHPCHNQCPMLRLQQLEQLYLCGTPYTETFSLETLLDTLICLYDECCNSTLRKEKAIAEFVEFGKRI